MEKGYVEVKRADIDKVDQWACGKERFESYTSDGPRADRYK